MNYQIHSIGTDLEVFLKDAKTGEPRSVVGLLGGTKEKPIPILTHYCKGFAIQEDNVMAEFNIPATDDPKQFVLFLQVMKEYLTAHFRPLGLELAIVPSQMFRPEQLANKQAQTFGCQPDYDVWELAENEVDHTNPILKRMRTAGGHVHVSFSVNDRVPELAETFLVVKALDLFLGVPSVLLDSDVRRRKIYGRAGAFRPKEYDKHSHGIEYRTLSNFWFADDVIAKWVHRQVFKAFSLIQIKDDFEQVLDANSDKIRRAINENCVSTAQQLIDQWGIQMPTHPVSKKKADDGVYLTNAAFSPSMFQPATLIFDDPNNDSNEDEAQPEQI